MAMTLIVIAVVPVAGIFLGSVNAASANAGRQQGVALATSIISHLESAPPSQLGFTSAQLNATIALSPSYGWEASSTPLVYDWQSGGLGGDFATEQLIVVPSSKTFTVGTPRVVFAPVIVSHSQGTTFSAVTRIVYSSSVLPACSSNSTVSTGVRNAYPRVFVQVSWKGGQVLEQDSTVDPGGLGPYLGPDYNAAAIPPAPSPVTAGIPDVTGELTGTWATPPGWTVANGECFAMSWVDTGQALKSTGLLPNSVLRLTSGHASYTVLGLVPGGTYVLFVTAYSNNGVQSAMSSDAPAAAAPSGPTILSVSPQYGPYAGGTTVTLNGTSFGSPTTYVQFVSTGAWIPATCASTTSCVVTAPAGSGTATITAETPTGPLGAEVLSPPLAIDLYSYQPAITSIAPASGAPGTTVVVTGTNLAAGTTFTFGSALNAPAALSVSCTGGTHCTMTSPVATGIVDLLATNPGGPSVPVFADQYTYP